MTKILILLLATTLGSCSQNKAKEKIKSEQITAFSHVEPDNRVKIKSLTYTEQNYYDENQNLVEKYFIFSEENTDKIEKVLMQKCTYEKEHLINVEKFRQFDGKKIKEIEYIRDDNGKPIRVNIHSINENGERVLEKNQSFYTLIKYAGHIEKHIVYEFDEDAQEFIHSYTVVRNLDNRGNIIEEKRYDTENSLYGWEIITYDKKNNPVKIVEKLDIPSEVTQSYNSNNDRITYIYKTDGHKSKTTFNYKYDKNGNWIEIIQKGEDEKFLTKRKIEYY